VEIDLVGRIDTARQGIRTSFESVPDLPVSRFQLKISGGRDGLLVNAKRLCKKPKGKRGGRKGKGRLYRAKAVIEAHNGARGKQKPKLKAKCKKRRGGR
jgi:hypothetical protein